MRPVTDAKYVDIDDVVVPSGFTHKMLAGHVIVELPALVMMTSISPKFPVGGQLLNAMVCAPVHVEVCTEPAV